MEERIEIRLIGKTKGALITAYSSNIHDTTPAQVRTVKAEYGKSVNESEILIKTCGMAIAWGINTVYVDPWNWAEDLIDDLKEFGLKVKERPTAVTADP